MKDILNKMENELVGAMEKVRQTRRKVTGGVVEDRSKKLGSEAVQLMRKTYDDIDETLERVAEKAKTAGAQAGSDTKGFFVDLGEDVKNARGKFRDGRRKITGGVAEDSARKTYDEVEERLEKLIEKIKNKK